MIEHVTTKTNWSMVDKFGGRPYALRELTTNIEGCPYEINLRVEFSEVELVKMGMSDDTGTLTTCEHIVYELEKNVTEKELEIDMLMWHYIDQVKEQMRVNDTTGWRVEDWEQPCPWLFTVNLPLDDEVAQQELEQRERDSWT